MATCEICGITDLDENFQKCSRTGQPLYWRVVKEEDRVVAFCSPQHGTQWYNKHIKEKDANSQDCTHLQST